MKELKNLIAEIQSKLKQEKTQAIYQYLLFLLSKENYWQHDTISQKNLQWIIQFIENSTDTPENKKEFEDLITTAGSKYLNGLNQMLLIFIGMAIPFMVTAMMINLGFITGGGIAGVLFFAPITLYFEASLVSGFLAFVALAFNLGKVGYEQYIERKALGFFNEPFLVEAIQCQRPAVTETSSDSRL